MADTPALSFSDTMTMITGNRGGATLSLEPVTLVGGRERVHVSRIALASQDYDGAGPPGTPIAVARVPLGAALMSIEAITDTSLGSSTIAFGDAHDGNSAIYGAAATLTATNTLTRMGPPTATTGVPISAGYDYAGNLVTANMPQVASPGGGALFEDIIMTVGVADLPASGNLVVLTKYTMD